MIAQTIIETVDADVVYDASEATDQSFIIVQTAKGPLGPIATVGDRTRVQRAFSEDQWESVYGGIIATGQGRRSVRLRFKEGVKAVVTSRIVGPAALAASRTVSNSVPATVLKISAQWVGQYGNEITTQFVAGDESGVQLIVIDENGKKLQSPDLTTQPAVIAWAATTGIITVAALSGVGLPVVDGSSHPLASGTDDHASITDADLQAATDRLNDWRLGPGQVEMPGYTTATSHNMLEAHADPVAGFDRFAILDYVDTPDAGTIAGNAADDRNVPGDGASMGAAPWVATPDGDTLPPGGYFAAKMAASDLATQNPNLPAAGPNGQADWIDGLTADWSDADRTTLDDAGVNVIRDVDLQGTLQIQGYSTLTGPTVNPLVLAASNARLDMWIRWRARKTANSLEWQDIDENGHLVSRYHSALDGMMQALPDGAVWAYSIDTADVNTPDTAAAQQLKGRIGVQRTQYSKVVYLDVTNYPVNAPLGV